MHKYSDRKKATITLLSRVKHIATLPDAMESRTESEEEKFHRKLPYFHRIQNQADKDLIGDFTPKLMPSDESATFTPNVASSSASWNTANTWEERDCSEWSHGKITDIFKLDFNILCDGYRINLTALENLKGNSQVTHVQGKPRYFYDYSFSMSFEISGGAAGSYKGTLLVEDVVNDQLDDIEISLTWGVERPPNNLFSCVKSALTGKIMKAEIKRKVVMFENAFKQI